MNRSFSEIHGFYKVIKKCNIIHVTSLQLFWYLQETKTLIGPEDVYIQPKQVLKKVRKKVSRKGSRGSSFRNKDKEKTLSARERDGKSNKTWLIQRQYYYAWKRKIWFAWSISTNVCVYGFILQFCQYIEVQIHIIYITNTTEYYIKRVIIINNDEFP